MKPFRCLVGFSFLLNPAFAAEELPDAATVIQELKQSSQTPDTKADDSPLGQLKKELAAFAAGSSKMAAAEAGKKWVTLIQKWKDVPNSSMNSYREMQESSFDSLIKVIPPPPTWGAIQKTAAGNPLGDSLHDSLLTLLAATLANDEPAKWKALVTLQKFSDPSKSSGSSLFKSLLRVMGSQQTNEWLSQNTNRIAGVLIKLSDDPVQILAALEIQLKNLQTEDSSSRRGLSIPDLVTLAGEEKARAFLLSALAAPGELNVKGIKTRALLRELVLENPDKLKAPQWDLVSGIDESDIKLYEALAKKFDGDGEKNYDKSSATGTYLLALVAQGKTEEATKFVLKSAASEELQLPYQIKNAMLANGYGPSLYEFLFTLLQKNPALPFWDDFITVAAAEHETAAALELAQKALQGDLSSQQRIPVLAQLGAAYLAHGEIEKGVANLRERLKLLKAAKAPNYSEIISLAETMASLGRLLPNQALLNEGLTEALAATKKEGSDSSNSGLIRLLLESNRQTEALDLAVQSLQKRLRQQSENHYPSIELNNELTQLAGIYDATGKSADVLVLLTEASWWGASDLAGIAEQSDFRSVPLGLMAARAFLAGGDKESARRALQATIRKLPNEDSAYAMLVELDGAATIPFLDELFARDRFQERPLIWKALLLLSANQLEDAEKIIRAAITIDPSDGEMGKGDRMRAYAVLADILEAKGKNEDAKLYRNAVAAIRLSEEADDYQSVGLLSQAVDRYEKALLLFADAYCIQSRLAIQFMELGDPKKAEAHYLKAYELMPDSFGRMESHCFGCERAFKGELAETLAEKTFRKLLEENPSKPQLHYLLGYLRYEQDRYPEALEHFRKAVELDPDYINAWKKILSVGEGMTLPSSLRDEATLALLRLDPLSRHGRAELNEVSDLKKTWAVIESLQGTLPPEPKSDFFPLTASAQQRQKKDSSEEEMLTFGSMRFSAEGKLPEPREVVASHDLIRQVSEILTQLKQMDRQ